MKYTKYINKIKTSFPYLILSGFFVATLFVVNFSKDIIELNSSIDQTDVLLDFKVNPLDGYNIFKDLKEQEIYKDGVKYNMGVFHNKKGEKSIVIKEIKITTLIANPTKCDAKPNLKGIRGKGTISPNKINIIINDESKFNIIMQLSNSNTPRKTNKSNIIDGMYFKLTPSDDIELFEGSILLKKQGLFNVSLVIDYMIDNKFYSSNIGRFLICK